MYRLTDAAKNAFKDRPKHAELTFTGTGETFVIAPNRLKSLQFSRSSASGNTIAIGETNASTLTLDLDNSDGFFSAVRFSGGEFFCSLYADDTDGKRYYLPVGYFEVAEAPRKSNVISVDCFDRMVLFDRKADFSGIVFPVDLKSLTAYICRKCGVPLSHFVEFANLPNGDYTVQKSPEESDSLTYRKILMWVCEITASNAYFDWDGELRLSFYTDSGEAITASDRYSHDLSEVDNTITGVNITADDTDYLAGSADYALNIVGNDLIQTNAQEIADNIFSAVGGFTYRPFTAETVAMPWIYPLDIVCYREKNGTEHSAIVTNTEYKMNGRQITTGVGENTLEQNLSPIVGFSARETAILKSAQKRTERELTTREQSLISLNETIANALGVYSFETEHSDGAKTFYFGNAATLESSNYIFTMNGGGFAWTNKWNGAETAWQYGIDKNGNAILNYLSVNKLSAKQIEVSDIVATINSDNTLTLSAASINLNGYISANGSFTVDEEGFLNATGGTIGGYTIGAKKLTAQNVGMSSSDGEEWAFWAGANKGAEAPYHVGHDGSLYAAKGEIGGCKIENGALKVKSTNIESVSADKLSAGKKGNFQIDEDGNVTAENAKISGDITARAGSFETQDGAFSVALAGGLVKIKSPSGYKDGHTYVPLIKFYYGETPKFLVADFYTAGGFYVGVSWKIIITGVDENGLPDYNELTPSTGGGETIIT